MKTFVRSILFTSVLASGASTLLAAPAGNYWLEQWYRAKYGRSSPMEAARQANMDFCEETVNQAGQPANTWLEGYYKAKFGLRAEPATRAFREGTAREIAWPATNWLDQWHKTKFGRSSQATPTGRKTDEARFPGAAATTANTR